MNIIPKVECRRCGREFSGLRSRCPYCGTTRVRAGDTVPPITASEVPGTPASQRAEVNTRWQTIFGLLLLACVVLAVIVLITISLADAKEIKHLRTKVIDGLVVQNPYNMGYVSVNYARKIVDGERVGQMLDTGVTFVTADNMNDEYIRTLLPEED